MHQKSIALRCLQFGRADGENRQGKDRRQYCRIDKGFNAVYTAVSPSESGSTYIYTRLCKKDGVRRLFMAGETRYCRIPLPERLKVFRGPAREPSAGISAFRQTLTNGVFFRSPLCKKDGVRRLFMAGETRFEHATYGFGDRYSTVEPLPCVFNGFYFTTNFNLSQ